MDALALFCVGLVPLAMIALDMLLFRWWGR